MARGGKSLGRDQHAGAAASPIHRDNKGLLETGVSTYHHVGNSKIIDKREDTGHDQTGLDILS